MTEDERNLLMEDIKAAVIKELTGKDLRVAQDNTRALKELYNKYRQPLYDKYGVGTWANIWDCVRKLAVYKMGHVYVRDLLPSEEKEAAEFAEGILKQFVDAEDVQT